VGITRLRRVTILVRDQEAAFKFYTEKLGFVKKTDAPFPGNRRWLTVAPKNQEELEILLEPLEWFQEDDRQWAERVVGNQPAGVLETDDCRTTFLSLQKKGVEFVMEPTEQMWGIEARFRDSEGNEYSLLEPKPGF
jgi:predicted enzyme related to lactoylglutathione lyase